MQINEIVCSDALRYISKLPDKSIDLTLTDIPYGEVNRQTRGIRNLDKGKADVVTFELDELINEICRVTKKSIYIFCGIGQISEIRDHLIKHKLSTRLIVWEKTNPSPMNGDKIWLSGVEVCVFGKYPKATFNGHCLNTVIRHPICYGKIHPTQKPVELIEKLINISSNPGDVCLDPFMGSGTTAVAALMNGRNFVGCDIDTRFVNLANDRICALRKQLKLYDVQTLLDCEVKLCT